MPQVVLHFCFFARCDDLFGLLTETGLFAACRYVLLSIHFFARRDDVLAIGLPTEAGLFAARRYVLLSIHFFARRDDLLAIGLPAEAGLFAACRYVGQVVNLRRIVNPPARVEWRSP